jgi:serine/threonine protein kinase
MDPRADQADQELARLLHAAGRLPREQLQQALAQSRAQRSQDPGASLASLLTGSGVIHPAEIEQLVASATPSQSFVRPVAGGDTIVDSLSGSENAGQARWRVGRRIGNFELIELLGRGGMGVVFRARHVGTGRMAALKGLLIDDEEGVERFAREALAQSSVDSHPNVADVYETGQADGKAFLAMELIEGGDLESRLKERGRLPGPEAARIMAQLARGLEHVHASGILHRDLKPANVLFASDGTPKLVDFGMARLDRAQRLTQTGQIVGTPAFMAPEQAMGVERIDARADVYGLGAILFMALTDTLPFQGATAMEVLSRVISDDPPSLRSLAADLDPALEAICLRAMAKDPKDRYRSAAEFADALEGWTPSEDTGPAGGVRFAWLGGGLALGLALGIGLGFALAPREKAQDVLPLPTPASSPLPAVAPSALPSPSTSPSPTPTPPAQPSAAPQAPTARIANESLRRGTPVLVEIKHPDHPNEQTAQLGWIASCSDDEFPEVEFFVAGGHVLGPVRAPARGFRRDAFGIGARVLIPKEDHEAKIQVRLGPLALVERQDQTRAWLQVSSLTLLGEGVDASAAVKDRIYLAPWSENESLYPAVVVARTQAGLVRLAYLENDGAWVSGSSLRPLPSPGEAISYGPSEDEEIRGRVVSYPSPWLVEIAPDSNREERILAEVLWVYVSKRDQDR